MTPAERSSARLQIMRVLFFMVQIIRLHLVPFLMLSLVIVGIPAAIMRYQEAALPDASLWDLPMALPFAFYVIAVTLLTAIIARMIVPDGSGDYPSLARSIEMISRDVALVSVVGLVSNVVVLIGFFLLIVPGLILGVLLSVLVPVRAIEQTDLFKTLVRGVALTKGNRWPILVLLIGGLALDIAGSLVINVMIGDPILAGFTEEPRTAGPAAIIGSALIESLLTIIGATATAVVYCELARIKDARAPAALASEFD